MTTNKYEVVVIDYNTGNVDSVIKAIKHFGKSVILSNNPKDIINAAKIILPGQGSFNFGMEQLEKFDLIGLIKKQVEINKVPILGICLGMQLLADVGNENKTTSGLGFIPGEIKKMTTKLKLPHIGWNEVNYIQSSVLFRELENNKDFYFVHSYYYDCLNKENILATSDYDFKFPSIIGKENIFGCQFHPEKSLKSGLKLLNNFLEI
ncbi:MAG: imidazole glycerol phosphate synthase subunit HisH [Pelagibacterales bacterium]|nr:imidazole glycerol phosphate synthase subunit HisH [Pelagibacterales bacterium]